MTQPTEPPCLSPVAMAREQVLLCLSPFFLAAACGNPVKARAAAEAMLDGFATQSTEEWQLAAQITAFGFAALESLRASADKDLPVNITLRLRGNANAMNRSATQCRKTLDALRKARTAPAAAAQVANPAGHNPTSQNPNPAETAKPQTIAGIDTALVEAAILQAREKVAEAAAFIRNPKGMRQGPGGVPYAQSQTFAAGTRKAAAQAKRAARDARRYAVAQKQAEAAERRATEAAQRAAAAQQQTVAGPA
jgi:hypothetical protein